MAILIIFFSLFSIEASAHPVFFEDYKQHPRALEKANCSICHFDKNGGGKLQQFGLDFAQAEYKITQEMLKKYPGKFKKE